ADELVLHASHEAAAHAPTPIAMRGRCSTRELGPNTLRSVCLARGWSVTASFVRAVAPGTVETGHLPLAGCVHLYEALPQVRHVAIEFGAGLGIGRADGELVDVAVLVPALIRDLGIDLLARVVLLLRQVEDVAVRIMAAVGGEGPRRWTLHDVGVLVLLLHA